MAEFEGGVHAMRKFLTLALLGERYLSALEDWTTGLEGPDADVEETLGRMLTGSEALPSPDLAIGFDPDDLRRFADDGLVEPVSGDGSTLRLTAEGIDAALHLFECFAETAEHEFDWHEADRRLGPMRAFRFSLELEDCDCRREIVVPADFTFEEFHEAIQAAFNWMNYHLWDFTLRVDGNQVTVTNLDENDPMDGETIDLTLAKTVAGVAPDEGLHHVAVDALVYDLDKAFPHTKVAIYRYDYGDGWEITIRLEEDIEEYEGPLPVCVGGAGDAPPEDVGGPGGFQDFKRVMREPNGTRKRELAQWAEGQDYEPFSVEGTNRNLSEWGEVALF